jgi:hypothetical protein
MFTKSKIFLLKSTENILLGIFLSEKHKGLLIENLVIQQLPFCKTEKYLKKGKSQKVSEKMVDLKKMAF